MPVPANETYHQQHVPAIAEKKIWDILKEVYDPEIPVLSIVDLGVVRAVQATDSAVTIDITPTYSGCPAMDMIAMNIRMALLQHGYGKIQINTVLSPAWTTDWMTEEGKARLKEYGIAPPVGQALDNEYLETLAVPCPRCQSSHTRLISQFASTSCKAMFQCHDCHETFDYFKCH